MLCCRLKCTKNAGCKNPKIKRRKNKEVIFLSKCAGYDSKKLRSIKEQKTSGLLTVLGIRKALDNIPIVGPTLF